MFNFLKKLFGKKQQTTKKPTPQKKSSTKTYCKKKLLTKTELRFQNAISKCLNTNYILLPQINLASIINRTDEHKYQNELYRNIDFCIFDTEYNPILLIEINDKTHKEKARIARDYKVKDICQNAELPLVTFWTDYGVNDEYVQKRIAEYIK